MQRRMGLNHLLGGCTDPGYGVFGYDLQKNEAGLNDKSFI